MTGVGVETGSKEMMKKIKKNLNLDIVNEKVDILRHHGIITSGFFILGLPGETEETMNETIEFALQSHFKRIQICIYTAFPGSQSFNHLCDTDAKLRNYLYNDILPITPMEVTIEQVNNAYRNLLLRFYGKPIVAVDVFRQLTFRQIKDIFQRFIFEKIRLPKLIMESR